MQLFQVTAQLQGVKLKLNFPIRDFIFRMDADRTKQIIINLVSNAIKFSTTGQEIEISVDIVAITPGNNISLQVMVTDQGIGLNQQDRENLFKPYFRSSSAENLAMNLKSNGIGLYLSKQLAKVLGGDLTLSS